MNKKKKQIISIVSIIVALPLAIATAAGGGGMSACLFAALLAIAVDMLIDRNQSAKILTNKEEKRD